MANSIIALSGPRACGKSTIARHLEDYHEYTRLAFADVLREIAAIAGQEYVDDRLYLSNLGKKLRELDPDFVLQVMQQRLDSIDGNVAIEDIRFPAELDYCNQIGAMTVRLEISIESQRKNLSIRGTEGIAPELLIYCEDESALDLLDDWKYLIPAVGDFRVLAKELDLLNRIVI